MERRTNYKVGEKKFAVIDENRNGKNFISFFPLYRPIRGEYYFFIIIKNTLSEIRKTIRKARD